MSFYLDDKHLLFLACKNQKTTNPYCIEATHPSGTVCHMTTHDSRPEPILTIPEVAAHLRRHPRTIWRWIHDGTLRSARIGGSRYVRVADVDCLLRGDAEVSGPVGQDVRR